MTPPEEDLGPDAWSRAAREVCEAFRSSPTLASVHDRRRELEAFLRDRIGQLLREDPARLMSILYRIDVRERELMECLEQLQGPALIERLSEIVIARQLEKIETRQKYRSTDP